MLIIYKFLLIKYKHHEDKDFVWFSDYYISGIRNSTWHMESVQ